ncbi:cyclic-phosphate processing receiver domain-containing protein [Rhodococcus qingshengii]|uniref:cyclic-phosphate processing receiver domain-containing protein n=1 Tax=Rhodococcus qingshengii TaxID=334542 RepID=UPI0037C540F4
MKLFVDDERPAPDGWVLRMTAEAAIETLRTHRLLRQPIDSLSLDHDLGYATDTIMPLLFWLRDNDFWPRELYIHTANEDGEEVMLGFIKAHAPEGTLKGYGCNFWGTGPDSQIQNWVA